MNRPVQRRPYAVCLSSKQQIVGEMCSVSSMPSAACAAPKVKAWKGSLYSLSAYNNFASFAAATGCPRMKWSSTNATKVQRAGRPDANVTVTSVKRKMEVP